MELTVMLGLFLIFVQSVGCQKQSASTCAALEELIEGRAVQRAGETCVVHNNCDSFNCVGVVDDQQDPPVVADTTYTFLPCEDPPAFSVLATVTSFDHPVLDQVVTFDINGTVTIPFNPDVLGTIDITLVPTQSGVVFGARVDEPFSALEPNYELFPEVEVPLECVAGAAPTHRSLLVLFGAALLTLLWSTMTS